MVDARDDATDEVQRETSTAISPKPQRRSFLDRLAASGHQSPKSPRSPQSNVEKELPAVPPPDALDGDHVANPEIPAEGTAGMPERSRSFFERFGAWGQQNANTEGASAAPMSDITSHDGVGVETDIESGVGAPQRRPSRLDRVAAWGHPDGTSNRAKASAAVSAPTSTTGVTDDSHGGSEVGTNAGVPQRTQSRLDRWAAFGHKDSQRPAGSEVLSDAGITDSNVGVESSVGAPQRTRSRLDRFADLGHRDGGGWRSPTAVKRGNTGVAPSTAAEDIGHSEMGEVEMNADIPQRSPSFLDRLAGAGHRDTRRNRPIAAVTEEGSTVDASTTVSSPTYSHGAGNAEVDATVEIPQRKPSILDRLASSGHQQGKRKALPPPPAGEVTALEESATGITDNVHDGAGADATNVPQQQGSWLGWMTGGAGPQSPTKPPTATADEGINVPPTATDIHSDNGVTDTEVGTSTAKTQRRSWLDRIAASGHREGERSPKTAGKALPAVPGDTASDTSHDRETANGAQLDTTVEAHPSEPVGEKAGGFKRRLDRLLPPQKSRGWFGRRNERQAEKGEKGLPELPSETQ